MMLFQGYNWIRIFALLGMVTYAVNASPLSDSLGTTLENAEAIKAALARGTYDSSALQQLIHDAELALKVDTFSVTDNPPVPPSGSRNDYYSWAPYWWPDPNAQDGYPYISRDGKTNPETERKSDKPLLRRMAMAVQTLALAYYYR